MKKLQFSIMEDYKGDGIEAESQNYAGVELKPGKVESYEVEEVPAENVAMYIRMHKSVAIPYSEIQAMGVWTIDFRMTDYEHLRKGSYDLMRRISGAIELIYKDSDCNISRVDIDPQKINSIYSSRPC